MAGIGFALRKLVQRDNLSGVFAAFAHSTFAAAGPWFFTVICLATLSILNDPIIGHQAVKQFRIIVSYANCFAIILVSAIVMVSNRYLADSIYQKNPERIPGLLIFSLLTGLVICAIPALIFYGFYFEFSTDMRILCFYNFCLVGAVTIVGGFLTAIKDYITVSTLFLVGMIGSLVAATYLGRVYDTFGMLLGYSLGLTVILFMLVAKILSEYPYTLRVPQEYFLYFKRHYRMAVGVFIYNAGSWVDKWIMWFAPEGNVFPSKMLDYETYDSTMFLAFLSVIPAIAIFTVVLESNFYQKYVEYYQDITNHASLEKIEENHRVLVDSLGKTSKDMVLLQIAITFLVVLMSPYLVSALNMHYGQLGIFRVATLGAFFQIIFMYICILLIYFDMQSKFLWLQVLFFILNAVCSFISMKAGFPFYGYGYFIAAMLSMFAAYVVFIGVLGKVPYLTFIGNNMSAQTSAFIQAEKSKGLTDTSHGEKS